MTEARKPPGISWNSYAEKLIREAQEEGKFDNLPGMGKPIPGLDGYDDELWWIKEKLRRERLSLLPPSLQIRADVSQALERIWKLPRVEAVRQEVALVNENIRQANLASQWGPPSTLLPLDVEEVIVEWRRRNVKV